jgi:signal transduction histidine kinase
MADGVADHDVAVPRDLFPASIAVLAVLTSVLAIATQPGTAGENLVAAVAAVPLVVWARWPRLPTLAVVVLVGVAELFALGSGELEPLLFMVSLAAVVVGARESSPVAAAAGGMLAVATPVVVELVHHAEIAVGIWVLGVVLPLCLGRIDKARVELGSQLFEARQQLARQAVLDERRRVARDVHDLVGHGLAAVMLQVTGARHVLRRDPDAADEALAEAEAVGRRNLHELGRTLSLLRSIGEGEGGPGGAAPPVPDLGDIARAVDAARSAGVDAEFRSEGDVARVDPIVGLCLYRVAEEALANVARHAPGAMTDVKLTVDDDQVALVVESMGPSAAADPEDADRPRYGLIGMRERMATIGGEFDAGPTPAGWLVRCRAPIAVAAGDGADSIYGADGGMDVAGGDGADRADRAAGS